MVGIMNSLHCSKLSIFTCAHFDKEERILIQRFVDEATGFRSIDLLEMLVIKHHIPVAEAITGIKAYIKI